MIARITPTTRAHTAPLSRANPASRITIPRIRWIQPQLEVLSLRKYPSPSWPPVVQTVFLMIAERPAIACQNPSMTIKKAAKYVHPTAQPLRFSAMDPPPCREPPSSPGRRDPGTRSVWGDGATPLDVSLLPQLSHRDGAPDRWQVEGDEAVHDRGGDRRRFGDARRHEPVRDRRLHHADPPGDREDPGEQARERVHEDQIREREVHAERAEAGPQDHREDHLRDEVAAEQLGDLRRRADDAERLPRLGDPGCDEPADPRDEDGDRDEDHDEDHDPDHELAADVDREAAGLDREGRQTGDPDRHHQE